MYIPIDDKQYYLSPFRILWSVQVRLYCVMCSPVWLEHRRLKTRKSNIHPPPSVLTFFLKKKGVSVIDWHFVRKHPKISLHTSDQIQNIMSWDGDFKGGGTFTRSDIVPVVFPGLTGASQGYNQHVYQPNNMGGHPRLFIGRESPILNNH